MRDDLAFECLIVLVVFLILETYVITKRIERLEKTARMPKDRAIEAAINSLVIGADIFASVVVIYGLTMHMRVP